MKRAQGLVLAARYLHVIRINPQCPRSTATLSPHDFECAYDTCCTFIMARKPRSRTATWSSGLLFSSVQMLNRNFSDPRSSMMTLLLPMIIRHEHVFIPTVCCKGHRGDPKTWKGSFESIESCEGPGIPPLFTIHREHSQPENNDRRPPRDRDHS